MTEKVKKKNTEGRVPNFAKRTAARRDQRLLQGRAAGGRLRRLRRRRGEASDHDERRLHAVLADQGLLRRDGRHPC